MKKNIVALAVASAIAAPVAMADAPTVYGQMNMALEQFSVDGADGKANDAKSGTQVNSIASRLGVKGSSDLGNGLKAVYKVEFGLTPDAGGKDSDDNGTGAMTNRNQYVGLAGGFGTVLMGRHDTPTKMIQAKDLFNDGNADNKPMAGGLGVLGNGMENRRSNVLAYVSPSFGGVKLVGALVPKEDGGDAAEESTLTDLYSVAAMYGSKKEGLYLAAGMDQASSEYVGGDDSATHVRVVAQYATGGLIANAMYQDFSGDAVENTDKEGTNYQFNVGYKIGKFMPKAKVSMVNRETGLEDSTNYALGVNYSLGKKTTAYVDYSYIEHSVDTTNVGGEDYFAVDGNKSEQSAFSVGLLHKF